MPAVVGVQAIQAGAFAIMDAWEALEEMVYNDVMNTCAEIQPMEKEWGPDAFQKKIMQYLKKAAKNTPSNCTWQAAVQTFCSKFYENVGTSCYDRPWLDQADFALCASSAIKAYCKAGLVDGVSHDEFIAYVAQSCAIAHDLMRYNSTAWETFKAHVPNKVAQKKVREAVDAARENVPKSMPASADLFMLSWVQMSVDLIAKDSFRNNPKASLVEADAVKIFDALVQSGGLPLTLEVLNGGKPPPGWPAVASAVASAYAAHGDLPPPRPKGKDGGSDGGKGVKDGGFDSWGAPKGKGKDGGFGAWGGKGGFDPSMMGNMKGWGKGWSPY